MAKAKLAKKSGGLRSYFQRTNLLTSLILVFPVFLVYEVGVLALPSVHNGADLITSELLSLMHGQIAVYILCNLGLALAFLITVLVLRRKNSFDPRLFVPILFESGIYALSMGSLILFVMQDVLHVSPQLAMHSALKLLAASDGAPHPGFLGRIVLAFGAGVHEELVFRLLMIPALAWIFGRLIGMRPLVAMALAFVISAFLFSAAHHVIGGEPFRLGAFIYRFLCGLWFALLYRTRGFAQAVYTHALYDIYVLTING